MSKYLPEINFEWSQTLKEEPVRPRLVLSVAPHSVAFAYQVKGKDIGYFHYLPNESELTWEAFWNNTIQRFGEVFHADFGQITVFHQPTQWVLIPLELIDEQFSEQNYLHTLFHPTPAEEVYYGTDNLPEVSSINSYLHDIKVIRSIQNIFPDANHTHLLSKLIRIHYGIHQRINQGITACIELIGEQFAYLIFKEQKLLFANLYPMTAPEDIVYYIFRVNQTLMINAKDLHLYISGHWSKKEATVKLIRTYFLNFYAASEWLSKSLIINDSGYGIEDFSYLLSEE